MTDERDEIDRCLDLHLDAEITGAADWERDFREMLQISRRRAEEVVAALECRIRTIRTTPLWDLSDEDLVNAGVLARAVARCHSKDRES